MTLIIEAPTYATSWQRSVALFHDTFRMPNRLATPGPLPENRIDLRLDLIREEGVDELRQAVRENDPIGTIDALIDTIYVGLGALVEMGMNVPIFLPVRTFGAPDTVRLLKLSKTTATEVEIQLTLLKTAFERSDAERAVGILHAIIMNAFTTLYEADIDPQPFFDDVQRANMSKLDAEGQPIFSRGYELDGFPEGKALKGPFYRAPDLLAVFVEQYGSLEHPAPRASAEFERGARAAAEAMRLYFLNENEQPMYNVSSDELESFVGGSISDTLRDERTRLERALVA